jgi:pyrroline-5-carboxylate reductase
MTSALPRITFFGAGRMASALAIGFVERGGIAPPALSVHDPAAGATASLAERLPGIRPAESNEAAAADCDLAILAVKPQHVREVAEAVAGRLPPSAVLVSVVAGLALDTLADLFRTRRIVRVMPNTPCLVGAGSCVVCRTTEVADAAFDRVCSLLASTGSVHVVGEALLDAATGLSGSGPAFVAVVLEALADGGVRAGLPRDTSLALACEILSGTAALIRTTGEHPAVIKDRVASPAGTTIEGLAILEQMAVRAALSGAVIAAARRSAELGRS